jgi:Cdc6-like AAA superfamily ATPase
MSQRAPERVFTPNAIATSAMFARRNEPDRAGNPGLQDRVIESLQQPGTQLRVFGETGVGKTSLVAFAAAETDRKLLTVECRSSQDFTDLIEQAISKIQGVRLTSYVKHRSESAELAAEGKVPFLASITGKVTGHAGRDRTFEIVQKSPVDLLIDLMSDDGYTLLVLDNFQNIVDQGTRTEIAQMMEVLSDRSSSTGDLKLVVVGIAEDAQTLLTPSPSVRRRTVDVGVPGMPDDEIRAILETGFRLLELKVDQGLLDYLVFYTDGFPFFAHTLGLNVARVARRAKVSVVSAMHLAAGLHRTLNEVDETYATRIRMAVGKGDRAQPKNQILQLLAQSTQRTWTCQSVVEIWERGTKRDSSRLPIVETAMAALITHDHGAVLTRDETSTPHRYRFSDPYFRAYLRLASELGLSSGEREEQFSVTARPDPLTSFPGQAIDHRR